MNKEIISALSNVVIAISTFIGVGAAVAYYLIEFAGRNILHMVFIEIEYLLVVVIVLIFIKRNINRD